MTTKLTRRSAAGVIAGAAFAPFSPVRAAPILELKAGGFRPINIAVTNFSGDDAARTVTSVVNNNFKRSVFLKPIDMAGLASEINPDQSPIFARFAPAMRNSCSRDARNAVATTG